MYEVESFIILMPSCKQLFLAAERVKFIQSARIYAAKQQQQQPVNYRTAGKLVIGFGVRRNGALSRIFQLRVLSLSLTRTL